VKEKQAEYFNRRGVELKNLCGKSLGITQNHKNSHERYHCTVFPDSALSKVHRDDVALGASARG